MDVKSFIYVILIEYKWRRIIELNNIVCTKLRSTFMIYKLYGEFILFFILILYLSTNYQFGDFFSILRGSVEAVKRLFLKLFQFLDVITPAPVAAEYVKKNLLRPHILVYPGHIIRNN
uniref:Uncharacterized protein n=1 Tax=Heterorhabditis bacteriophora TaxID=37862 RepID=A0A1I7WDS3_HETBA